MKYVYEISEVHSEKKRMQDHPLEKKVNILFTFHPFSLSENTYPELKVFITLCNKHVRLLQIPYQSSICNDIYQ